MNLFYLFLISCLKAQDLVGYYSWNWGTGSIGPAIYPKVGIAFTGYVDVQTAIDGYNSLYCNYCPKLSGENGPWITIGGGNDLGMYTKATLENVIRDINLIKKANYSGVVFDIENVKGSSAEMIPLFRQAFARAKEWGLTTVVTTSHSAPTVTDTPQDAVDFQLSWINDTNIDIISPQLYTFGNETEPDWSPTWQCTMPDGCEWWLYQNFKGIIAPSIVWHD